MSASGPRLYSEKLGEYLDIGLDTGESTGGDLYVAGDADSSRIVVVGDIARDVERIAFAGVGGLFQQEHGTRGRQLEWAGNIRASATALAAIRAQRDAFRVQGGMMVYTDDAGTESTDWDLVGFEIGQVQAIQPRGNLVFIAPYKIVLFQLVV